MTLPILRPDNPLTEKVMEWYHTLSTTDQIVVAVCLCLSMALLGVLMWWLKTGKERFIKKRCPERLSENESDKNRNCSSRKENNVV